MWCVRSLAHVFHTHIDFDDIRMFGDYTRIDHAINFLSQSLLLYIRSIRAVRRINMSLKCSPIKCHFIYFSFIMCYCLFPFSILYIVYIFCWFFLSTQAEHGLITARHNITYTRDDICFVCILFLLKQMQ